MAVWATASKFPRCSPSLLASRGRPSARTIRDWRQGGEAWEGSRSTLARHTSRCELLPVPALRTPARGESPSRNRACIARAESRPRRSGAVRSPLPHADRSVAPAGYARVRSVRRMLSTSGGLRVPRPLRFRSHGRSAFRVSTPGGPRQSPRLRIARPLAQRVFTDDDLRPAKPLSARRRAPPSMHRSALPERTRFLAAPHLLLSLWLASGLVGDAVQYSDFEPDWVMVCHSHDDDGDGEDDIEHEDEDGDDVDDVGDEQGGEEGVGTEVHISNVGICVGREHGGEERTLSRTNGFLGTPASPFAEYAEKCGRGKLCTGWEARTRAADRPSWPLQRPPDSH
ncbi:MAG: hypothetical protein BJ554DRAFT_4746, partial [Olpidium bornovanus]